MSFFFVKLKWTRRTNFFSSERPDDDGLIARCAEDEICVLGGCGDGGDPAVVAYERT
jgi:hypothetical protein